MATIRVDHKSADRFSVTVRGHELVTDQPADLGGDDAGPTPTELFVAGLAACVAFFARRFLARHGLEAEGLRVQADYVLSDDRPARVATIRLCVRTAEPVPLNRRAAFLRVLEGCTVHNSLRRPPAVELALDEPVRSATG
jgi:putative redox protein